MTTFWNWLAKSSANPDEVALTVKGLVTSLLPIVLIVFHNPNLSTLPDAVYSIVVAALGVCSAVAVVIGLLRKFYVQFTTQN